MTAHDDPRRVSTETLHSIAVQARAHVERLAIQRAKATGEERAALDHELELAEKIARDATAAAAAAQLRDERERGR